MGQSATAHDDPAELVSELASLGHALLGLQSQLAALGPEVAEDPRARHSLARSRAIVTDLHLRAWERRNGGAP